MLQGTWVRELTWYGVSVENESALYFSFKGNTFSAMMYDQSNLGKGPMRRRLEEIKSSPERLAKTPTLTFVDCDYWIVDKYYKISDEIVMEGVDVKVQESSPQQLKSAFDQMVAKGFFSRRLGGAATDSLKTNARSPIDEVLTPSVGGAYWTGALQTARTPQSGRYMGAALRMNGDYRGSHVGTAGEGADVRFTGTETAQFFMEGNTFVASALPTAKTSTRQGRRSRRENGRMGDRLRRLL
jgi:hypothetical protein